MRSVNQIALLGVIFFGTANFQEVGSRGIDASDWMWSYGKLARVTIGCRCPISLKNTYLAPVSLWSVTHPKEITGHFCQLVKQEITFGGEEMLLLENKFETITEQTCRLIRSNSFFTDENGIKLLDEGEEIPKTYDVPWYDYEMISPSSKVVTRKFYWHKRVNLLVDNFTYLMKHENLVENCKPEQEHCEAENGTIVWNLVEPEDVETEMSPINEDYCYVNLGIIICPKSSFAILPMGSMPNEYCYHTIGYVKIKVCHEPEEVLDRTETVRHFKDPVEGLASDYYYQTNFDILLDSIQKNSARRMLIKAVSTRLLVLRKFHSGPTHGLPLVYKA